MGNKKVEFLHIGKNSLLLMITLIFSCTQEFQSDKLLVTSILLNETNSDLSRSSKIENFKILKEDIYESKITTKNYICKEYKISNDIGSADYVYIFKYNKNDSFIHYIYLKDENEFDYQLSYCDTVNIEYKRIALERNINYLLSQISIRDSVDYVSEVLYLFNHVFKMKQIHDKNDLIDLYDLIHHSNLDVLTKKQMQVTYNGIISSLNKHYYYYYYKTKSGRGGYWEISFNAPFCLKMKFIGFSHYKQ